MTLQILEQPTQRCVTLRGVSWEQFEVIESALEGISGVHLPGWNPGYYGPDFSRA
jgi:hypothetical protein